MQKNCMHGANYRCPNCSTYTVKSNKEAGLTELKLEVGGKYDIGEFTNLILRIDKKAAGLELYPLETRYIFTDRNNCRREFSESYIKAYGIKEHREPYKYEGIYYVIYDPAREPANHDILDTMANKYTIGRPFKTKNDALKECDNVFTNIAKIEITAVITEE